MVVGEKGKRREGYKKEPMQPHSAMLVVLGTGLLWFGWFGFNAGSAVQASPLASTAFVATHLAAAFAGITWGLLEFYMTGKPTAVGMCTGFVAGLATVTPASGYVDALPAMAIGIVSAFVSIGGIKLREHMGYDDALDVFAVHGMGSASGVLMTGLFASTQINPSIQSGGWIDHGWRQILIQLMGTVVGAAWSGLATFIILKVLDKVPGLGIRVTKEEEKIGMDLTVHGEPMYHTVQEEKTLELKELISTRSSSTSHPESPGRNQHMVKITI